MFRRKLIEEFVEKQFESGYRGSANTLMWMMSHSAEIEEILIHYESNLEDRRPSLLALNDQHRREPFDYETFERAISALYTTKADEFWPVALLSILNYAARQLDWQSRVLDALALVEFKAVERVAAEMSATRADGSIDLEEFNRLLS